MSGKFTRLSVFKATRLKFYSNFFTGRSSLLKGDKSFIETVSDKVSGLFEKKEPTMAEKAADKIDAAKEYTQEKAHDASEGIKNAGDKTVDTGKNIGDDIKGAFK